MPRYRPKPASKSKQTANKSKRPSNIKDYLGDSSVDDEGSQYNTESFRSPESENQTDYGLEYTTGTARIRSNNPNSAKTPARRGSLASTSKASPHTRSAKTPVPREFLPSTSTASAARPTPRSAARPTPQSAAQPAVAGHRRKKNTPQNLLKRREAEIRNLQARTDHLIPRLPFGRLIRELLIANSTFAHSITPTALEALQASAEAYLTYFFQDAYMCTMHRGRVTLSRNDMKLIQFLRGP